MVSSGRAVMRRRTPPQRQPPSIGSSIFAIGSSLLFRSWIFATGHGEAGLARIGVAGGEHAQAFGTADGLAGLAQAPAGLHALRAVGDVDGLRRGDHVVA